MIGTGREIRQVVFAGTVACRFITDIRVIAARRYFGIGDGAFGGIGDAARKARVRGLRAKNGRERNKDQEGEGRDTHNLTPRKRGSRERTLGLLIGSTPKGVAQ